MKILVEGIPSAGREIDVGLGDPWAVEAAAVALDGPPSALRGQIGVRRATTKGVVLVDVSVTASARATCDRCGEPCLRTTTADSHLLYAPEEKGTEAYDGGEVELEAEDLDLGWYTDGEIILDDVLREALTLALPSRTTCADTQECDKRTDALLDAARGSSDPFAALRGWKPRTGEG
ncbi:MAG: DUF177 domain-containing protein [Alphaproteobacteria bacterium]|nr:DUF177 domain-containing protein [Alphaproteobacteria bacterium]MCB9694979.1 DUF177 domain-containing protein [Alphaproteobacteria bacterium]MCB9696340.1 DUF177 domain-containing protein [Alphaproteobacteria bacterium]